MHESATYLALAVLLASLPQAPAQDSRAPRLQQVLDASVTELCEKLEPGPCLVLSPQIPEHPALSWRLAQHLQATLQIALASRGFPIRSAERVEADLKARARKPKQSSKWPRDPYAPPRFRPGSRVVGQAAKLSDATWILTCTAKIGDKSSSLELRMYEASTRRRKATERIKLDTMELSQERNTPAANARVIAWVRARQGKKIGRGECWDLADQAIDGLGLARPGTSEWGKLLPKGAAYFPGDVIQWFKAESGRLHTAVIDGSTAPGHVRVLHQNWASGQERGRKVGPGRYAPKDLAKARVYRPHAPAKDQ